jgi:nucleotide-binding universal stress UspA family protein
MPLKDLLVVVDHGRSCPVRIDLAARLAQDFGAHLTGLYVAALPYVQAAVLVEFPADVRGMQEHAAREAADHARTLFAEGVERASPGLTSEWREVEGDVAEVASLHARYADMAVIGQTDPDEAPLGAAPDLPERLILGAGRPVLVVPYAGRFASVGARVLLAWNASREATRAANDALPLLQRASYVRVLSVNPRPSPAGHGEIPGADIALHLARHGVQAEVSSISTDDVAVDDMLLSQAADAGADLIVMGGYGHSRLGELVLGGATRHILRQITVPVFMSH